MYVYAAVVKNSKNAAQLTKPKAWHCVDKTKSYTAAQKN